MKILGIVQARLGSTRLPSKIFMDICGMRLIERVLRRVENTPKLSGLVVATTTNVEDDELVEWLKSNGYNTFRGSETDVLDRYFRCANEFGCDAIVRITADDPLKDPEIIGTAIDIFLSSTKVDYVSNTLDPSYPEGLDIEVFSYRALQEAHVQAKLPSEREHVTPYIWKNPHLFNIVNFNMVPNLSSWRWTVDKPEDLEFTREIYKQFIGSPMVSYRSVIELIKTRPELMAINTGIKRNEGYHKSLVEENGNG